MAQAKLKADTKGDNYGSISIEENANMKPKDGFFKRLHSRWTYKKLKNDTEGVTSFLSLVSYFYSS